MRMIDCHVPEDKCDRLWQLVEDPENFWRDLGRNGREMLKILLEGGMSAYRQKWTQAGWHEVNPDRKGFCNGFYRRKSWPTPLGVLSDVRVPRCREPGLTQKLLKVFRGNTDPMADAVQAMFLAGVSTRRVGEVLEAVLDYSVSPTTVSHLTKRLEGEVHRWHTRKLAGVYRYLLLDGVWLKARSRPSLFRTRSKARKRVVLVAYGITREGVRQLIDFRIAKGESATAWGGFLWSLYRRGLTGESVDLVTTDGGTGLLRALEEVYPFVRRQRCWFHKMQNVVSKVRCGDKKQVAAGLRKVYEARSRREAEARYVKWGKRWKALYPRAVACVDEDLEALLACFDCPADHRRKVRTTNGIERCFREVRRRTQSIGCFMDDGSIDRLVYALFRYMNTKQASRPCREFRTQRLAS